MPVRVVDGDERVPLLTSPDPRPRRHRVIIIGALVLVIAITTVLWIGRQSPNIPDSTSPGIIPPTTHPVTGADAIPPAHSNVTEAVVPGLWRGTATVTSGYGNNILGVPIEWPKTVDGAIGAAISQTASLVTLDNSRPSTARQLDDRFLTAEGQKKYRSTEEMWRKAKAWYHLDESGTPLNADGQPAPELRLYWQGFPKYSAYRVTNVGQNLETVTVQVWMPTVDGIGVGNDLSALRLMWLQHTKVMRWEDGDWRTDSTDQMRAPQGPLRQPNLSYEQIRATLGTGWSIPSDGSDQPDPEAVLSK